MTEYQWYVNKKYVQDQRKTRLDKKEIRSN